MDFITQAILGFAINKAAQALLSSFDSSVKLVEVDQKVDALLYGDYRAACLLLEDSFSLSGQSRMNNLQESMRLFELSTSRFRVLLESKRDEIRGLSTYVLRGFVKQHLRLSPARNFEEHNDLLEAYWYEVLCAHLVHEYLWLLCSIGSMHAVTEMGESGLINLKKGKLVNATCDVLSFVSLIHRKHLEKINNSRKSRMQKFLWNRRGLVPEVISMSYRAIAKINPKETLSITRERYEQAVKQIESWKSE